MIDLETELRGGLTEAADAVPVSPTAWADYRRRAPRRTARRRATMGLAIAGIVAGTAGIVVGVMLFTAGGHNSGPATLGGRSLTVSLTPRHPLTRAELDQSASILRDRLSTLGVHSGTEISTTATGLSATVRTSDMPTLTATAQTRGVLRFRQVLSMSAPVPGVHKGRPVPSTAGPAEAPTLTAALSSSYTRWNCKQDPNPTHGNDVSTDYTIGCDANHRVKYLLAPTAVSNSDITGATATSLTGNQHVVDVVFSVAGAQAWLHLTKQAYDATDSPTSTPGCSPPKGCNAIGIALDGVVTSAPSVQQDGIPGGRTQISGRFTQANADQLAAILTSHPLPSAFTIE